MSSRLMPPKTKEMFLTVAMNSSTFWVLTQMGKASTLPKDLKRTDFPSMTGRPAKGPMLPKPKTAEPSVMTATMFHFLV